MVGDEISGSGEYRRGLEASAIALGPARHVHFVGHRTDVTSVLAGLDVVVNPSMEESACYTMVEALLMERGVVASNVGGLPYTGHTARPACWCRPVIPRPWPTR